MSQLDDIKARVEGHTPGPWEARTTGRSGGDHWYICDDGESIAHISSNDGQNEDQRRPNAELMVAAPKLLAALGRVEALAIMGGAGIYGADGALMATDLRRLIDEALA